MSERIESKKVIEVIGDFVFDKVFDDLGAVKARALSKMVRERLEELVVPCPGYNPASLCKAGIEGRICATGQCMIFPSPAQTY